MKTMSVLHFFVTFLFVLVSGPAAAQMRFVDLGAFGMDNALKINNAGSILGYSGSTAILYTNNVVTDLTQLGFQNVYDINDSGIVVGTALIGESTVGVALVGNSFVQLSKSGFVRSIPRSINNSGIIAGVRVGNNDSQATLWNINQPSSAVSLQGFVGATSSAVSLNSTSQSVGESGFGNGPGGGYRATVWDGIAATDLGTLGGRDSSAYAINDAGLIVGTANIPGDMWSRAVSWQDNVISELPSLIGTGGSYATNLNEFGRIVGYTAGSSQQYPQTRATLWHDGTVTDLNTLLDSQTVSEGWQLRFATDINDQGSIVGVAYNLRTNRFSAYMLEPSAVPEPMTYVMLISGFGLLGAAVRLGRSTQLVVA